MTKTILVIFAIAAVATIMITSSVAPIYAPAALSGSCPNANSGFTLETVYSVGYDLGQDYYDRADKVDNNGNDDDWVCVKEVKNGKYVIKDNNGPMPDYY